MYKYEKNIALITGVTGQDGSYIASCPLETTSFEQLVQITVKHDMEKVAADHVASVMRTNLAEYLEKGIVK